MNEPKLEEVDVQEFSMLQGLSSNFKQETPTGGEETSRNKEALTESLSGLASQQSQRSASKDICNMPSSPKPNVHFHEATTLPLQRENLTLKKACQEFDPVTSMASQKHKRHSSEAHKGSMPQLDATGSQTDVEVAPVNSDTQEQSSLIQDVTKREHIDMGKSKSEDGKHKATHRHLAFVNSDAQPVSSFLPSTIQDIVKKPMDSPGKKTTLNSSTKMVSEMEAYIKEDSGLSLNLFKQKINPDTNVDSQSTVTSKIKTESGRTGDNLSEMETQSKGNLDLTQQINLSQTPVNTSLEEEHSINLTKERALKDHVTSHEMKMSKIVSSEHDAGAQADIRLVYKSVALGPINPSNETSAFPFQKETKGNTIRIAETLMTTYSTDLTPPRLDIDTQADTRAPCKSVALSPFNLTDESSAFIFQTETKCNETRPTDMLIKTCSTEFTHSQQNVSTQADTRAPCKSVALSPFNLAEGSSSFTFQTATKCKDTLTSDTLIKTSSTEFTHSQQDIGTQADTRASYKSVALSPFNLMDGPSSFTFQTATKCKDTLTSDTLIKTSSTEFTHSQQDIGTQADTRASYKSVALSPFNLMDGPSSFTFQTATKCKDTLTSDTLIKTSSTEFTHSQQDIGTQADTRAPCKSVALSPFNLAEGSSSFTFQTATKCKDTLTSDTLIKTSSTEFTHSQQDIGTQADTRAPCKSVALSPFNLAEGSSSFTFQTATKCKDTLTSDTLIKISSTEFTHSQQDIGTQADTRAPCKSVALSPFNLAEGSSSFTFQTATKCKETRTPDTLIKTCSIELTPPEQDIGTQADTRAPYKSVALSPFNLANGSSSFTFQTETKCKDTLTSDTLIKTSSTEFTHSQQDVSTKADTRAPCKSVALSPFNLADGSSAFNFQTGTKCKETRTPDTLVKTCSIELTPPQQDIGTQADTRAPCKSVALSPFNLIDGSSAFNFQTESQSRNSVAIAPISKTSFELKPSQQDAGIQADTRVPCISVAVSPINLMDVSSVFTFQTGTKSREIRTSDTLLKTTLTELSPSQQDAGTQTDIRVTRKSVAVSPINPSGGSSVFTFNAEMVNQELSSLKNTEHSRKDAEVQVSIPVETRSIAIGPMTPTSKSHQASYPQVCVKRAQEQQPEPVREVSWDEKGMTWEVYGASMEVEVLGMAIQKHLEKQIEEHGRQKVMTPENTRTSSLKRAPGKGEFKREPGIFRALLHNVRGHVVVLQQAPLWSK